MPTVVLGTTHILPRLTVALADRLRGTELASVVQSEDAAAAAAAGWSSFSAAVVDLAIKAGVQHAAVLARNLIVAATPAWDHLPVDDRVALQAGV
jgi:hypothetical protein